MSGDVRRLRAEVGTDGSMWLVESLPAPAPSGKPDGEVCGVPVYVDPAMPDTVVEVYYKERAERWTRLLMPSPQSAQD